MACDLPFPCLAIRNIERSVEVIGGVPQTVYKIPSKTMQKQIHGVSIHDIIDRVIIGPLSIMPIYEAFFSILRDAGD